MKGIKEQILCVYLCRNKQIIEKIARVNIEEIGCEKYFCGRKIDIYASTKENIEIYMEVQLNEADSIHFEQIEKIINSVDSREKIIIWLAEEFDNDFLAKINQSIDNANKGIEFMAIKLNEEINKKLDVLNQFDYFSIVDNMGILDDFEDNLAVIYKYYNNKNGINYHKNNNAENKNEVSGQKDKKLQYLNRITNEIKKQIQYFMPAYNYRTIQCNKVVYGTGTSQIKLQIGLNTWHNIVYVELDCENKSNKEIYKILKMRKDYFDDILDYRLLWDDDYEKIGVYMSYDDSERQIKEIVRLADKMLKNIVAKVNKSIENDENKEAE